MAIGAGPGGGRLFEGSDYFKYFHQRGAIIQGRRLLYAIIRGNTVTTLFHPRILQLLTLLSNILGSLKEILRFVTLTTQKLTRQR